MATKAEVVITAKNKTKAAFKGVSRGLDRIKKSVFNARTGIAALAGAAGLGALIKSSLASGDALAKTADKLGITTEALASLQHAAALTGVQQETLNKALTKQQKAIFDANAGLKTYAQHFDALGLSTEALIKLSPDEQFAEIGEALNKVENQTLKTAIAYDIFGGRGTALLNTLELGKEGLAELAEEAKAYGVALSRVDAAKIEMANDSFHRVRQVVKGVANVITVRLAPFLSAIADQFTDAAKASNGFETTVTAVMENVSLAIGHAVKGVHAMEFAWAAVKFAFSKAAEFIFVGLSDLDKKIVDTLNKLPLINLEYSATLQAIALGQKDISANLKKELDDIALVDPTAGINAFFEKVKAGATKAAEAIARTKTKVIGGGFDEPVNTPEAQKAQDVAAKKLEKLQESFFTEEQRLQESLIRRQDIVATSFESGLIDRHSQMALMEQLETDFESKLTAITLKGLNDRQKFEAKSATEKTKTVIGEAARMTQGVAQHSKTMFKINKAASLANAVISGYESFNKTMAAYPYPFNIGMAALGAAATGAQISAIRSTSFSGGGGGTTPSAAGGSPTINDIPIQGNQTNQQAAPTTANITILGGLHDSNSVRDLIESINEELGDGVQLNVTVAA